VNNDIRRAGAGDLAAVDGITRRAYAIYIPVLGAPVPMMEDYAPRIERGEVWLAWSGGEPAALIVLESLPDHHMIFSVAVDPAHAGLGLGRRLIAFAEERARTSGLKELRLYTNALMTRNIALYASLGFEETGRRPSPKRPGFTIVDMTKRL
jgi:ribosomal protein S18 acetylase RimI-like enzyme